MLIKTKKAKRLEKERNAAYYEAAMNYCRDNEIRNDDLYATYVNCNNELHKIEKREKIIVAGVITTTIVVAGVVLRVYLKPDGEVVAIENKIVNETTKKHNPVQHHVNERAVNDEGKFAHIECWHEDNENHYMYRTYWDKESTGKYGLAGGSGSTYWRDERSILHELQHNQGFKGHIQIDEYAREPRS